MSGAVCHADRGAGTDTALWMDADSRIENRRLWRHSGIRDAGSNPVCDVRPMLGESLLRRPVKVSSNPSVLNRQVANPAAAHRFLQSGRRRRGDSEVINLKEQL